MTVLERRPSRSTSVLTPTVALVSQSPEVGRAFELPSLSASYRRRAVLSGPAAPTGARISVPRAEARDPTISTTCDGIGFATTTQSNDNRLTAPLLTR
jgi:hypothetical protein